MSFPAVACSCCEKLSNKTYKCPCQHVYCEECMGLMFQAALSDHSMIPVKCCGIAVLDVWASEVLPAETARRYFSAQQERTAKSGMYCPNSVCSAFINLDQQPHKTSIQCVGCRVWLCVACRASHPTVTCDQYSLSASERSVEDVQFLRLAQSEGYMRCTRCGFYIEHAGGCPHMMCRCGQSFVYNSKAVP